MKIFYLVSLISLLFKIILEYKHLIYSFQYSQCTSETTNMIFQASTLNRKPRRLVSKEETHTNDRGISLSQTLQQVEKKFIIRDNDYCLIDQKKPPLAELSTPSLLCSRSHCTYCFNITLCCILNCLLHVCFPKRL